MSPGSPYPRDPGLVATIRLLRQDPVSFARDAAPGPALGSPTALPQPVQRVAQVLYQRLHAAVLQEPHTDPHLTGGQLFLMFYPHKSK